jgi:hypothetical protein
MKKETQKIVSRYALQTEDECVKAVLTSEFESSDKSCSAEWILTDHCIERLSERGFTHRHLLMAIEYGQEYFKQGMIFFVVCSKRLPNGLSSYDRHKLTNMVVVVSSDATVVTCYNSDSGSKHIKRKRKNLCQEKSASRNWLN